MHQEVNHEENMNDLKQKAENRTSDYVCVDCGVEYLTEKQKEEEGVYTSRNNYCGLCWQWKSITHIRKYNYLQVKTK